MGKPLNFTQQMQRRNETWQKGYSDGYNKRESQVGQPDLYYIGFDVGVSDRAEDDEAMSSGTFDLLDEDERKHLYGDESDKP